MKLSIYIFSTIILLAHISAVSAENFKELSVGDSVSSNEEANKVSEKVRKQIEELSKGILHGDPQFSMIGTAVKSGNAYFINGDSFIINDETVIYGEFKDGSFVEVRGNLVQGKQKVAKQIVVGEVSKEMPKSASSGVKAQDFPAADRR